jgi:hypothetical protein
VGGDERLQVWDSDESDEKEKTHLVVDDNLFEPVGRSSLNLELHPTKTLEQSEIVDTFVNRIAQSEETVILKNGGLDLGTHGSGDVGSFVGGENDACTRGTKISYERLSRRRRPFGRKERETRLAAERLVHGEVVVEEARVLD